MRLPSLLDSHTRLLALLAVLALFGPAATAGADVIYVANAQEGTVSVIDPASDQVVGTIPVGGAPTQSSFHPSRPIAYVSNRELKVVHIIDTDTHMEVSQIAIGEKLFAGTTTTPSGDRLLIGAGDINSLVIIDTNSATVVSTIPTGASPSGVAVLPDESRAFVSNFGDHSVSVVDLLADQVVNEIAVGRQPQGVSLRPDGDVVYVPNRGGGTVSVIDTATESVVATIPVDANPGLPDFSPDGRFAYLPNRSSRTLYVIDSQAHVIVGSVDMPGSGYVWAGVSPDGSRVYVSSQNQNDVVVIDTNSLQIVNAIPVGVFPIGLKYRASLFAPTLSVVSVAPDTLTQGADTVLVVTGSGFRPNHEVRIRPRGGVVLEDVTVVNAREMRLSVSVGSSALLGPRDIEVTGEMESVRLVDALTVVSDGN